MPGYSVAQTTLTCAGAIEAGARLTAEDFNTMLTRRTNI